MQAEGEKDLAVRGRGRPRGSVSPDELHLLALVRRAAPGPKSRAVISTIEMAEALGFSASKVKTLRRSMEDKDLINVVSRSADNGARVENSYQITRKGRRMLAAYEWAFGLQGTHAPEP